MIDLGSKTCLHTYFHARHKNDEIFLQFSSVVWLIYCGNNSRFAVKIPETATEDTATWLNLHLTKHNHKIFYQKHYSELHFSFKRYSLLWRQVQFQSLSYATISLRSMTQSPSAIVVVSWVLRFENCKLQSCQEQAELSDVWKYFSLWQQSDRDMACWDWGGELWQHTILYNFLIGHTHH